MYYSTGQAARELGVTQGRIRALCESEVIESTSTPGGQLRIPKAEVERLRREGLPVIPRPLPRSEDGPSAPRRRRSRNGDEVALLAAPSEAIIESAEEVAFLENEVRALDLKQQKEERLDFFREREDRKFTRQTEREEVERLRQDQADADSRRQRWLDKWIEFGLNSVPRDAPRQYQTEVHSAVEGVLERGKPTQPDSTTRQLVEAAVARALAGWHRQKTVSEVIREACEAYDVAWEMKSNSQWKARMLAAAGDAVAKLREGAGSVELKATAQSALVPLVREFEIVRARQEVIDGVRAQLPGATTEECEEGKEEVRGALSKLPLGTSRRELERTRATVLEPIRTVIAARQDQQMRTAVLQHIEFRFIGWSGSLQRQAISEIRQRFDRTPLGTARAELERTREHVIERYRRDHEKQERRTRLIEFGVRQILPYLNKMVVDGWELDDTAYIVARDLERPIREVLAQELEGNEAEDRVSSLVRALVRDELD